MSASLRARLLMAAGVVCGLALLALAAGGLSWLLSPARFPVTQVEVTGVLANTTQAEIRAALPPASGNFFALELAEVRASVERLPWVRRVSVRRVWPDRLELAVEEHVALARWGDDGLVNIHGEKFSARSKAALPSFLAPAGTSAEVALRYRRFSAIVEPLGTTLERVVLTQRHAWQLKLANGLHVMLGRDGEQAEMRLRRFVEAYAQGALPTGKREYIDLRYPNGFALRVPGWNG